jgi:hypothetical protein
VITKAMTDIVLAIVVTNRPGELERFLRSLEPARGDAHVHLVVLDNSDSQDASECVSRLVAEAPVQTRAISTSSLRRSPLHLARRELVLRVAEHSKRLRRDPLIWLLDDDLTFEELGLRDGRLHRTSVASQRLAEVREYFAEHPRCDVRIGGFTGDPPVRPESILATQLSDASFNLRIALDQSGAERWCDLPARQRTTDDFYDLTEHAPLAQAINPVPWVRSALTGDSTADSVAELLRSIASIPRGCAPFRPLLAPSGPPIHESSLLHAGGNTVFRRVGDLLHHPYPAMTLPRGVSRRSDMIGLRLLHARSGLRVDEGGLSLHHDRALQPPLDGSPHTLVAEFAGVCISRCLSWRLTDSSAQNLWDFARERRERTIASLRTSHTLVRDVIASLAGLRQSSTWEPTLTVPLDCAMDSMTSLERSLVSLLHSNLSDSLADPRLLEAIERFCNQELSSMPHSDPARSRHSTASDSDFNELPSK